MDGRPAHKDVTLREMIEAMAASKDDETFRWYQTSKVGSNGVPQPGPTLRVSMGQAREELGFRAGVPTLGWTPPLSPHKFKAALDGDDCKICVCGCELKDPVHVTYCTNPDHREWHERYGFDAKCE